MTRDGGVRFAYGEVPTSEELREESRARRVEPGAVPDISGKALTVQGPVAPRDLGVTITHEHLFVDLRKNHLPHPVHVELEGRTAPVLSTEDFPATELATWEAKVGLGNLHVARNEGRLRQ